MSESDWIDPHEKKSKNFMSKSSAFNIEKSHNIKGFVNTMFSRESLDIQKNGWQYERIIKGGEDYQKEINKYYITISNNWNDVIVYFKK